MNTLVSFEIAKLLTHLDFNQINVDRGYLITTGEESSNYMIDYMNRRAIAAPTIAEVVMWIYEKYNIWINVYPVKYDNSILKWTYSISKIDNGFVVNGVEFPEINDPNLIPTWTSPIKTYDEAIKNILI